MGKCCCTTLVASISLVVLGITLIGLSFGTTALYKHIVRQKMVMKPGSLTYKNWHKAPLPIYMKYYIFNYTNVDEIVGQNAIPNVTQLGPYSYRETRLNFILESNDDEITYMQNYSYTFDTETSCEGCSESDRFYTPSAPFLTVMEVIGGAIMSEANKPYIQVFDGMFKSFKAKVFNQHNVSELLWGYEDQFLIKLAKQCEAMKKYLPAILKKLNITLPTINPFVALQHNGSVEAEFFGNFTLLTGKENIDDIQKITHWKEKNEVPCWLTKYGRMINGTDGTHFKPFLEKDDTVYTFVPDVCRSLYLKYDNHDDIQDIKLYRFTTTQKLFLNATENEDNRAFCLGQCWPAGVMPIGQCIEGNPPAFGSGPHFYQSDPSILNTINGLKPEKEKHATLLSVEPDTGTTMKAHKRLQVNLRAKYISLISSSYCFPKDGVFLPVFYVDETFELDEKNAKIFKDKVLNPKKALLIYGKYSFIGVGALLVLVSIIGFVHFYRTRNISTGSYKKLNS